MEPEELTPESECECCGWPTNELKGYSRNRNFPKKEKDKMLCIVCASTQVGSAFEYPEQYKDFHSMAVTAWGINYLASLIKKGVR